MGEKGGRVEEKVCPLDHMGPVAVRRVAGCARSTVFLAEASELLANLPRIRGPLSQVVRLVIPESSLCVPLVARGRTLGALTLINAESRRHYGRTHLTIAEELARRCALALDNALLFKHLQQALRARDVVLSSVSHDLKNPLTAMRTYARLIQSRAPHIPDPSSVAQPRDWAAHIETAGQRMTVLVNELVEGFELEVGHPAVLDRPPTDLVALAKEVAAEQQQSTDRHQVQLVSQLPALTGDLGSGAANLPA